MNIFPLFFAAAKIGIGRGQFYFAATKIRIGRGPLLRQGQAPLRRLLLRIMPPSWHPVPACAPRRLCCRRAILFCSDKKWNRTRSVVAAGAGATPAAFYLGLCRLRGILSPPAPHDDYAAGGPFYFATTKIGIGRGIVAATTFRRRNCSTCRIDGVAAILDFRPRLANRCSHKAKTGANRASILDFKPRLGNRCKDFPDNNLLRASILDFRPRLANRCSIIVVAIENGPPAA